MPFIVGAPVKERPSGGASNICAGNVVLRQIFDVWKSLVSTTPKHTFVGADGPVRPQNGAILWEFYANLLHSHGRQSRRPLHLRTKIACGFAAGFRENAAFARADRDVRPYNGEYTHALRLQKRLIFIRTNQLWG